MRRHERKFITATEFASSKNATIPFFTLFFKNPSLRRCCAKKEKVEI